MNPLSSSRSHNFQAPRSEMSTPDERSIEPTLRAPSEEKLPADEKLGKELESGDGLATAITVQKDSPPPEGGRGWWVMLGVSLGECLTFAFIYSCFCDRA